MSCQPEPGDGRTASFRTVFALALRGVPARLVGAGGQGPDPRPLPVAGWLAAADLGDHELLLRHCAGPTVDLGCGPGRLTEALVRGGHHALGVDVVPEAVRQTRARGAAAVVRDLFHQLPGEGRWRTALLADGNIGIGGEPAALLRRVRRLVHAGGRVVVEVAPPGERGAQWLVLEAGSLRTAPFAWARVGADAVDTLAAECGLRSLGVHSREGRWSAVLEVPG